MSGPILYSTNTFIAHDIAMKYRGGKHFVWCCEYYDSRSAPALSAAGQIAPSSNPKRIYDTLHEEKEWEDGHSELIRNYRKTFKRLAKIWVDDKSITVEQSNEIIATIKSSSAKIWRPLLFVIPKAPIEAAGRLITVPRQKRAAYGPELQIVDLMPHEFDVIER